MPGREQFSACAGDVLLCTPLSQRAPASRRASLVSTPAGKRPIRSRLLRSFFSVRTLHPSGGPAAGGSLLHVYLRDDRLLVDLGGYGGSGV